MVVLDSRGITLTLSPKFQDCCPMLRAVPLTLLLSWLCPSCLNSRTLCLTLTAGTERTLSLNRICPNEKYTGCARIQKTFTPDFLTKKVVKNTGQVPSYFVEQSHPAIIAPETFELVQAADTAA